MSQLRTTVLGVVQRNREYLVQRLIDPSGEDFYRPVGGVEFGETSDEALVREFRAELGLDVSAGPIVGTIENRFTWDGQDQHEIVVLRRAEFADESLYDRERFDGGDDGGAVEYVATWRALDDLTAAEEPLSPDGLAGLLRGELGDGRGHVTDPRA